MNNSIQQRFGSMLALAITGVMLLSSVHHLSAQTTTPAPREASALWTVATNSNDSVVTVKWAKPLTDLTVSYAVYFTKGVATGATPNIVWTQLLITSNLTASFTLRDLQLDSYQTVSFKIRARYNDTTMSEGVYATAGWKSATDSPLKFTTEPGKTATINTAYVYDANATSSTSPDAVLKYAIVTGPDAMTIDSSTGIVTWTPTRSGTYTVTIKAMDAAGHVITQTWVIVVAGATEPHGLVTGTISDSATGNPISGATVLFYSVGNGQIGKAGSCITGAKGGYEIRLAPGTYRVQAMATGYDTKYWDGVFNGDDAKLLVVVDSGTYTVDIALGAVVVDMGKLSGYVYNSAGKGIAGAKVIAVLKGDKNAIGYGTQYATTTNGDGFYTFGIPAGTYIVHAEADGYYGAWADSARELAGARAVQVSSSSDGTANITLGTKTATDFCVITGIVKGGGGVLANAKVIVASTDLSTNTYSVTCTTNGEGRYTASVPCGQSYTVYASAEGFVGEYFENQNSPLDANPVKATGTMTVNFELTAKSSTGVILAGTAYACDSTLVGLVGKVTLYRIGENTLDAVATVYTTDGGAYTFTNVDTGVYLLQALPKSLDYAPSYYNSDKSCATEWQNATRVTVSGTRGQDGLSIYCKKISARHGFASLLGHVRNIVSAVGTSYLAGGLVFATNAQGELAGYAATDTSGSFEIDNIDVGTYTLVVDKAQYQTLAPITLSTDYGSNAAPTGDISAQKTSVSAVKDPTGIIPTALVLGQNYPNPFNPTTEISFALPANGNVMLAVYAMTGQRVATLASGFMQAGTYHATFDASNLPSGTYVYRLETALGVIARRMVELK